MDVSNRDLLKRHGLKVTHARIAVLDILSSKAKPLTVVQIYEDLQKQNVQTDEATLYRILGIFVEKKLINRIEIESGKSHYELASLPHHHHAICRSCGKIEDVEECLIKDVEKYASKKAHFTVESHRLELYGLCSNCK